VHLPSVESCRFHGGSGVQEEKARLELLSRRLHDEAPVCPQVQQQRARVGMAMLAMQTVVDGLPVDTSQPEAPASAQELGDAKQDRSTVCSPAQPLESSPSRCLQRNASVISWEPQSPGYPTGSSDLSDSTCPDSAGRSTQDENEEGEKHVLSSPVDLKNAKETELLAAPRSRSPQHPTKRSKNNTAAAIHSHNHSGDHAHHNHATGHGHTTTITVATMLILVTITFIITMTTATSKSHLRRADSRASLMLLVGSMTSVSTSLPPLLSVWPLLVSCAFQQVHRVLDVRNSQGTRSGKPQCSALRSACDPSNRRPTSVPRGLAAVSSSHAGLPISGSFARARSLHGTRDEASSAAQSTIPEE